jgi:hypothetical protein
MTHISAEDLLRAGGQAEHPAGPGHELRVGRISPQLTHQPVQPGSQTGVRHQQALHQPADLRQLVSPDTVYVSQDGPKNKNAEAPAGHLKFCVG